MTRSTGTRDGLGPGRAAAWWTELPPAAGAAVMATAIVSVGLHLSGADVVSRVWLAMAAALWCLLARDFVSRLLRDRDRWSSEADTPPALTAVAATTVLGTRLSVPGWQVVACALLALAAVIWPGLLIAVVRHWQRRMPGAAFLVCVATQGLAVLAATLSLAGRGDSLAWAALAALVLGLVLYAEALARFDFRQVRAGAGDQWIGGGALAISALAASKLTLSPPVDRRRAHGPADGHTGPARAQSRLVRGAADRRNALAPLPLRHPALVHRLPAGHDGGRLALHCGSHKDRLAAHARPGPAVDRAGDMGAGVRGVRTEDQRPLNPARAPNWPVRTVTWGLGVRRGPAGPGHRRPPATHRTRR